MRSIRLGMFAAAASMMALAMHPSLIALPPEAASIRNERRRRQARRGFRDGFRERRHASWPYCGKRHTARLTRQVAGGQKRAANGVVNPAF